MNETSLVPTHVREAIEAACKGAEVSLINLEVRGQHRQLRMEISIDSPSGITHEQCRAVSRGIDDRLNEDEYFDRLKAVDVSSPGAETPVRFLWQLTKHVGRIVHVKRTDGTVLQGTLLRADDTGLDVQLKSKERSKSIQALEHVAIPATEISVAHMVITL